MISSCYFNLHKKCISVKTGNAPVKHFNEVFLSDVRFHVNESGRQRVIEQRKKNVHAFVKGLKLNSTPYFHNWVAITYNPYKFNSFVRKDNEHPVTNADFALVTSSGTWAVNPR